ncbi:MAG: septum formation initiator family protein [Pseudomonadota bacterium]|tara:strand:+ start:95 stop:391 length:297 start_codon:yes stop_codon:yes gene_type:complete
MRWFSISLLLLFLAFQYELWKGSRGVDEFLDQRNLVKNKQSANKTLADRNKILVLQIQDLKGGLGVVEERARYDLGMIKKKETFYQVIKEKNIPISRK